MPHKHTITLETERLALRQFTNDDAEAMFRNWVSDPDVARYMHYKQAASVNDARELIRNFSDTVFAVTLKSTNELIGHVEYGITDEEARAAELAYFLGKAWWYNGYAAEALSALIKHAFETAKLNRLFACHRPQNPNSGAVMRKSGMRYEGTFRQNKVRNGQLVDTVQYAILAEDYFSSANPFDRLIAQV